ncbi:MAG: nitrile hydratase subunit beta [Chloroflexota bacterium]
MNSIHDLGGMHGFGKIPYEADEPVFHAPWEGRVYAMSMYAAVAVPGGFRYMIEKMDPTSYLNASYYEKWLHARTQGMLEKGIFTQEELDAKIQHFRENPAAHPPIIIDPKRVEKALHALFEQQPPDPQKPELPKFKVGDIVRAKNMHPVGHTRLPRYCRGKQGIVDFVYDYWRVDDTQPPDEEHAIEPLYRIKFEARELWGNEAEANQLLYIDMFESYLDASQAGELGG